VRSVRCSTSAVAEAVRIHETQNGPKRCLAARGKFALVSGFGPTSLYGITISFIGILSPASVERSNKKINKNGKPDPKAKAVTQDRDVQSRKASC
jgi:hypothetical protein